SANYFHLLRRQAQNLNTDLTRPLILASPKSLLRNQTASKPVSEFINDKFEEIIYENENPKAVKTELVASGKITVELEESQKEEDDSKLLIKLEQLYPFPKEEIKEVLDSLPKLKEVRFVQEEPKNQGSYRFVEPNLRELLDDKVEFNYVGRNESASPAEGNAG